MAKHLTYEELMDYAKQHYNRGGDMTYECMTRETFDMWVNLFGPMTKPAALRMFRVDLEYEREIAAK